MVKANADVRQEARSKGVKHWQIAEALKVHETTVMRMLRVELPEEKKKMIIAAINTIAEEMKKCS